VLFKLVPTQGKSVLMERNLPASQGVGATAFSREVKRITGAKLFADARLLLFVLE
jgi:hypothetical protein